MIMKEITVMMMMMRMMMMMMIREAKAVMGVGVTQMKQIPRW